MLSFFPRGALDEILNLIESVSEDFPSYSNLKERNLLLRKQLLSCRNGPLFRRKSKCRITSLSITLSSTHRRMLKPVFPGLRLATLLIQLTLQDDWQLPDTEARYIDNFEGFSC